MLPAAGDVLDRGFIGGEGLWYVGMATAREAETRVLGLPVGTFVVRKTANGYYLCVSYEKSARQIAITSTAVCCVYCMMLVDSQILTRNKKGGSLVSQVGQLVCITSRVD